MKNLIRERKIDEKPDVDADMEERPENVESRVTSVTHIELHDSPEKGTATEESLRGIYGRQTCSQGENLFDDGLQSHHPKANGFAHLSFIICLFSKKKK